MKCVHEYEKNGITICGMDSEQCVGTFPEHQKTDCQYCQTKEDVEADEYLSNLTEKDLEAI